MVKNIQKREIESPPPIQHINALPRRYIFVSRKIEADVCKHTAYRT